MRRSTRRHPVKWVVRGIAALIGLVLLVVLIGYLLPRDHVARVTARLAASPDDVWRALTDVASYPEWRRGVRRVDVLARSGDQLRWRETSRGGTMTFGVVESEPGRRWRVRILDENLPFGGSWAYELSPDGPGTSLSITEDGSVYNPVFRFVSRFVMGHEATMRAFLDDLRVRLGEEPA